MTQPSVELRVALHASEANCLEVELELRDLAVGPHELVLPVWTPGSYLVREYARHVSRVAIEDALGRAVPVVKVRKNRWRFELAEPASVRASYRVYARDLSVRTNHRDELRVLIQPAATFLLPAEAADGESIVLRVDEPEGWVARCDLDRADDAFYAGSRDELYDAPIHVSPAPASRFTALGAEHEIVWDGVPSRSRTPLAEDLERVVEAAASIFGGSLPYERYRFVIIADDEASGGLEHANSCVLHMARSAFRRAEDRPRLLSLCAHEHFHAWNIKRIRPEGLATFDYERENYTPDLWLAEGFTTYYQEVVPLLAGLYSRETFLARLAANCAAVFATPGRFEQSCSEASFDAWIKLYRPDETTKNSSVSYYAKGALAAFCLDLRIQALSQGSQSLDAVLRGLYAHYEREGPGQSRDLLRSLLADAAGSDLGDELALLVDSREDPPLGDWLAPFGLRYVPPEGEAEACLDAQLAEVSGRSRVTSVARGGAGEALGLSPGDEIIAIDGERLLPDAIEKTLREQHVPGQPVELLVFRRGLETRLSGELGARCDGKARIEEEPSALRFRAERTD